MVMPSDLISKKVPSFTLDTPSGSVSPKEFLGKKLVIYFYPKDNTPGCTIEAMEFTKNKKLFDKKNAVVIGISKDSCDSHQKFIDKKKLSIILASDPDHIVQEKFGVWRLKKFMGREFMGTVRSTFLINEKGKVVKVWDNVKVKGHVDEVLNSI